MIKHGFQAGGFPSYKTNISEKINGLRVSDYGIDFSDSLLSLPVNRVEIEKYIGGFRAVAFK